MTPASRPQSLPRFVALWMASYLAPMLATSVVGLLVLVTAYSTIPAAGKWPVAIVQLALLPTGLAFGQWLLMCRYVRRAIFWTAATTAAALLAQLSNLFVPELTGNNIGRMSQLLFWVFEILAPVIGFEIAATTLTEFPRAVCSGIAWSIPQGLALPGPRFAKIVWIAALLPTGFIMVVMTKALTNLLLQAYVLSPSYFWFRSLQVYYLPVIAGWATLSLVGGAVMYWNLRRRPDAEGSTLYARFD